MSQSQLEREVGKGRNFVRRLEEGLTRELPEREVCDSMARAMNVEPISAVWEAALQEFGREDVRQYYEEACADARTVTATERALLEVLREVDERLDAEDELASLMTSLVRYSAWLDGPQTPEPAKSDGGSAQGDLVQALRYVRELWRLRAPTGHNVLRAFFTMAHSGVFTFVTPVFRSNEYALAYARAKAGLPQVDDDPRARLAAHVARIVIELFEADLPPEEDKDPALEQMARALRDDEGEDDTEPVDGE